MTSIHELKQLDSLHLSQQMITLSDTLPLQLQEIIQSIDIDPTSQSRIPDKTYQTIQRIKRIQSLIEYTQQQIHRDKTLNIN